VFLDDLRVLIVFIELETDNFEFNFRMFMQNILGLIHSLNSKSMIIDSMNVYMSLGNSPAMFFLTASFGIFLPLS
jgi:hypothetical protein